MDQPKRYGVAIAFQHRENAMTKWHLSWYEGHGVVNVVRMTSVDPGNGMTVPAEIIDVDIPMNEARKIFHPDLFKTAEET